ncbi:MAG: hypothetical protein KAI22_07655 [Gammaproteobacteria bacterium]|nr:hypothetical protein [Gammaproteobacteria bacterium]
MNNEQAICNIKSCIALLAQHKKIHNLSLFLTIGAIVAMMFFMSSKLFSFLWFWPLLIIIVIGIFELIIAMRIGFDQALLNSLAKELYQKNDTITEQLHLLDNALNQLKLIPTSMQTKASRTLNERLLGGVDLFKKQFVLCGSQVIIVIIFIAVVIVVR